PHHATATATATGTATATATATSRLHRIRRLRIPHSHSAFLRLGVPMSASVRTGPEPAPTTPPGAGARIALGTMIAACLAVCLGQIGLAIPATLNGLFQEHLHPIGAQLTWISDAFLLPVTVLELTFGVLGDLFGRKRLLVSGAVLLGAGEVVAAAG